MSKALIWITNWLFYTAIIGGTVYTLTIAFAHVHPVYLSPQQIIGILTGGTVTTVIMMWGY
jgi:hypothetical protein